MHEIQSSLINVLEVHITYLRNSIEFPSATELEKYNASKYFSRKLISLNSLIVGINQQTSKSFHNVQDFLRSLFVNMIREQSEPFANSSNNTTHKADLKIHFCY